MRKVIKADGKHEIITISTEGLTQVILELPKKNSSKKLDVVLSKEGADVEILGAYILDGNNTLELVINAIHKVPNTKCLTQIRGVLKDSSYSSFKGMIKIEKNAQQTNSYLDDDVLILGKNARNESEPTLEIEADNVKATHGATTGRISEEQVFYLTSRGLTKEQAEELIVKGFLEPVLAKIRESQISVVA
ncbi:MAG: SufD family Fe-S cluster assembly protein [Patescibacteria group bacterium]